MEQGIFRWPGGREETLTRAFVEGVIRDAKAGRLPVGVSQADAPVLAKEVKRFLAGEPLPPVSVVKRERAPSAPVGEQVWDKEGRWPTLAERLGSACQKCGGSWGDSNNGYYQNRTPHPPAWRHCSCVDLKRRLRDVAKIHPRLDGAPRRAKSDLVAFAERSVWISATEAWMWADMYRCFVGVVTGISVQMITDGDLHEWRRNKGFDETRGDDPTVKDSEHLHDDFGPARAARRTSPVEASFLHALLRPDLLIIRPGSYLGRKSGDPVLEALLERAAKGMPTWIWTVDDTHKPSKELQTQLNLLPHVGDLRR